MVKIKYSIIWDDIAKLELKQAYKYIKKDSPANALSVRNNIIKSVKELKSNPFVYELDRFRKKNDGSYLAFEKHGYRIMYKVKNEQIIITGIRHSSRNPLTHYKKV